MITTHKNKIHTKIKGFTLVEALVSLGIFSIVVVFSSGVILSLISSNKKNQAVSSVVNNLNYSIDSMVRDIKTGYQYQCDVVTISGTASNLLLNAYKFLPTSCNDSDVLYTDIMLVSTISGKEQLVKYELKLAGTSDAYIEKTLYKEDEFGTVTKVSYPQTDKKNITIGSLYFKVSTPLPLIPTPDPEIGKTTGQPGVFLTVKGTAKVNQINISDFFIQTYISQRLPNFI